MTLQSLAIVIPTYNEANNLTAMVAALRALPFPDISIFIVDDNSPDGTGALADELAAQPDEKRTMYAALSAVIRNQPRTVLKLAGYFRHWRFFRSRGGYPDRPPPASPPAWTKSSD